MSQEQQNTGAAVTQQQGGTPDPRPSLLAGAQNVPEWGTGALQIRLGGDINTNQPPHFPHPPGTGLRTPKLLPPVFWES